MSKNNCLIKSSQVFLPNNIADNIEIESNESGYLNNRNLDNRLDEKIDSYTQKLSGLKASLETSLGNQQWFLSGGIGKIVNAYTDPNNPEVHLFKKIDRVWNKPVKLNGTTVTSVYAYFYWNGADVVMGYQEAAPIADDLADKLFLCAIISANGTTIDEVHSLSLADEPYTKYLLDYGAVNVDNVYPEAIANTMRLSFPGGRFKFAGRNANNNIPGFPHTLTYTAIAEITYSLCDPDGNVLSTETDFNFNRYWNGSQVALLSNPSYASTQFLYLFPSGTIAVVLGTNEYTSLDLAASQWMTWESQRMPAKFRNNTYFLGAIAGVGNATNIADTTNALISKGYSNNLSASVDYSDKVGSSNDSIDDIIKLTQAQYDALTPDPKTLYVIENPTF